MLSGQVQVSVTQIVIWSGPGFSNLKKSNCYLVVSRLRSNLLKLKLLSGWILGFTTTFGDINVFVDDFTGIRGCDPLIRNSLRGKLKLERIDSVGADRFSWGNKPWWGNKPR